MKSSTPARLTPPTIGSTTSLFEQANTGQADSGCYQGKQDGVTPRSGAGFDQDTGSIGLLGQPSIDGLKHHLHDPVVP